MALTIASYLGPNAEPVVANVAASLNERGIDARVVPAADPATLGSKPPDVVWACGLLTVEVVAAAETLTIVAAPVFDGEAEPVYRSVIIARHGDGITCLEDGFGRRLAVNESGSWSGFRGLHHELGRRGHRGDLSETFSHIHHSGSHVASINAVATNEADVAAIDNTVWRHVCATNPGIVAELSVIDRTGDWPSPPFSVVAQLAPATVEAVLESLRSYVGHGVIDVRPATADQYRFMID